MTTVWLYLVAVLTAAGMGMLTVDAFENGGIGQGCICAAVTLAVVGTIFSVARSSENST